MAVFNEVINWLDKNIEPSVALRRMFDALEENSYNYQAIFFSFSDWKRGGAQRAIEQVAELEPFQESAEKRTKMVVPRKPSAGTWIDGELTVKGARKQTRPARFIANMSEFGLRPYNTVMPYFYLHAEGRQLSLEKILEVVDGMGSQFEFKTFRMTIWDISSNDPYSLDRTYEKLTPQSCVCIEITQQKTSSKKVIDIFFPTKIKADTGLAEGLTKQEQAFVDTLQRTIGFELKTLVRVAIVDNKDSTERDDYGKPVREAMNSIFNSFDHFDNVVFPNSLSSDGLNHDESLPRKAVVERHFKRRGFDVGGASGIILAAKEVGALQLRIEFDFGSWSRNLTALLNLEAPGWSATLTLPCATDTVSHRLSSEAELDKAIGNMAAAYDHVEQGIIKKLEQALTVLVK
jgi:hypothetical protein